MKVIKIIYLTVAVLFFSNSISAQIRDLSLLDKHSARWSLGVKGGIDYFCVKPHAEKDTKFKTVVLQASWTAPVLFGEYTHNDIFAFGLESGYFAYNRGSVNIGSYAGGTFDAVFYTSINLSNLASKSKNSYNSIRRVSWYGNFGLGGGYYHYKNTGINKVKGESFTPLGFLSATCAVNLTNDWEIFAEGQYRFYFARNMGGEKVNAFTSALAAFIGVRYKIF